MTTKLDLTKFKWYEYDAGAAELVFDQPRHNEEYELQLHPGNIYGVEIYHGAYLVVHKNSPDIIFRLNKAEFIRINDHSRGWTGKIRKITVNAGEGGLDKPAETLPKGWFQIDLDSSNLRTAIYNPAAETLYITFHAGASWAYENVTMKEFKEMEAADSRGRYFIYRIRDVKTQYKLGDNFDRPPYDTTPLSPKKAPAPLKKTPYTAKEMKDAPHTGGDAKELKDLKAKRSGDVIVGVSGGKKPAKKSKPVTFEIPENMKVNGRAKIKITHVAHPGKSTTKTWSGVGFEWLGSKHPELGRILGELYTKGTAQVDDGNGLATLTLDGEILIPEKPPAPQAPATHKPSTEHAGKQSVKLKISKQVFDRWMDSEQGSFEDHHEGSVEPKDHTYVILRRQRIDSETDYFKLVRSLTNSTLLNYDKRAFNTAAKQMIAIGDSYPFTEDGAKTYKAAKASMQDLIRSRASAHD